jgi:hypothetical protein
MAAFLFIYEEIDRFHINSFLAYRFGVHPLERTVLA